MRECIWIKETSVINDRSTLLFLLARSSNETAYTLLVIKDDEQTQVTRYLPVPRAVREGDETFILVPLVLFPSCLKDKYGRKNTEKLMAHSPR